MIPPTATATRHHRHIILVGKHCSRYDYNASTLSTSSVPHATVLPACGNVKSTHIKQPHPRPLSFALDDCHRHQESVCGYQCAPVHIGARSTSATNCTRTHAARESPSTPQTLDATATPLLPKTAHPGTAFMVSQSPSHHRVATARADIPVHSQVKALAYRSCKTFTSNLFTITSPDMLPHSIPGPLYTGSALRTPRRR